ncbi:hypothetical protein I6E52_00140 [Salinibacterium sp. NG253]|uniref:hypothetical protein n=1 Tax=Salinibacterium sp. NG253 TaxID=2792039 RepID=UPI0018CFD281|nr:hypothetical protein [Salinibacterium sp. NG253]MBH0115251.1 hypothetical protein [Salinibacterium sp. NG253]
MNTAHSAPMPSSVLWARTARVAAIVLAVSATLAACSPAADELADSATTEEATTTDETTGDEGTTDEPATAGFSTDDVGNATLRINGVEFPDFTGDCEISRGFGTEDVGDLNDGDIVTIIGIDNVDAHEDMLMNYIALNEESFRFRDQEAAAGVGNNANGTISTLTEISERTPDGSRDIVEVRFAGAFEDGTPIEADVVCELQNKF